MLNLSVLLLAFFLSISSFAQSFSLRGTKMITCSLTQNQGQLVITSMNEILSIKEDRSPRICMLHLKNFEDKSLAVRPHLSFSIDDPHKCMTPSEGKQEFHYYFALNLFESRSNLTYFVANGMILHCADLNIKQSELNFYLQRAAQR